MFSIVWRYLNILDFIFVSVFLFVFEVGFLGFYSVVNK